MKLLASAITIASAITSYEVTIASGITGITSHGVTTASGITGITSHRITSYGVIYYF